MVLSRRREPGGSVAGGWLLVGVAGVGFQVVHLFEHLLQLGYWGLHPAEPPWLTPWAAAGRDILAVGGHPSTGSELLHLLGNLIFLVGVVGLWGFTTRSGVPSVRLTALRAAFLVQSFHVGEHVLLTVSWILAGEALGFSTLFGSLSGPALFTFRIWWHFLINLAGTALAVRALFKFGAVPDAVRLAVRPGLVVRRASE
jgi:hypothetical protein